jgi:hypothetical protein
MLVLEWMKIRMPIDWWCQLILWLDVMLGTAFFENTFFLFAMGYSFGVWLAARK